MNSFSFAHSPWYKNLPEPQQQLIRVTVELLVREKRLQTNFVDYSFILFPISKAYEGYIKFFLRQHNLISAETYAGRKFRVGRAMNPDVSDHQKDIWWIYDDVKRLCDEEIAKELWQTWLTCRNHVFHYFPNEKNYLTISEVEVKIGKILSIIERASYCKIAHH